MGPFNFIKIQDAVWMLPHCFEKIQIFTPIAETPA